MAPTTGLIPDDDARVVHRSFSDDAADLAASMPQSTRVRSLSPPPPLQPRPAKTILSRLGLNGLARRTIGMALLLLTVFLWTMSNFMASYIFSDNTYSKPFFLVYINSSVFAIALIPAFVKYLSENGATGLTQDISRMIREHREERKGSLSGSIGSGSSGTDSDRERLLVNEEQTEAGGVHRAHHAQLNFRETMMLSLEFMVLWVLANYFSAACLEHTSVASVTILTSTSSMWTLIFGALTGVESFTVRKLMGVLASLTGVVLISLVDLSGQSDENRGSFPYKSTAQIALGDTMAFVSAMVYGIYVTVMKKRVGNEDRVDMRLFFGLVGTFTLVLLWPVFIILHLTEVETFELPPTGHVWTILIANALASFVSDISWAFAMLLTTPLVVTVGLSLTIPLSLVGEILQYGQYSSILYWIGALIVFISFAFISHETKKEGVREHSAEGVEDRAVTERLE
ncbi:hypothetical protein NLU13_9431 [Sarocladium strictum]|uniref:DUF3955 domain-containing protein n=1 Tax=Sarocladium strictum TaxID=5046 RepID=A0AA39GA46_SARSR|nr:hypothetical protein NLU13_9431 [Sarocladium strictum]